VASGEKAAKEAGFIPEYTTEEALLSFLKKVKKERIMVEQLY